jgi:hypothetical protein
MESTVHGPSISQPHTTPQTHRTLQTRTYRVRFEEHEVLVEALIEGSEIVHKVHKVVPSVHECEEEMSELRLNRDVLEQCLAQHSA